MTKLETSRLILRSYALSDLDHLAALYADADVTAHTKLGQLTRPQAETTLREYLATWRKLNIGVWAAFLQTSGEYVGETGLFELDNRDDMALRYAFHKHVWGRGLAYEAAHAVTNHAFRHQNMPHILAFVEGPNAASHRIAKKLGFTVEGTMAIPKCELYRYGVSASEWVERN